GGPGDLEGLAQAPLGAGVLAGERLDLAEREQRRQGLLAADLGQQLLEVEDRGLAGVVRLRREPGLPQVLAALLGEGRAPVVERELVEVRVGRAGDGLLDVPGDAPVELDLEGDRKSGV